jgi:hypothetical protein
VLARGFGAAAVELIEWKKILVARALWVNPTRREKCVDAIQDPGRGVVLSDRLRSFHVFPPLSERLNL